MPLAPRGEAQLHDMHGDVNKPNVSARLADVMEDIDKWEGKLIEYYKCGGDVLSDKTKKIVVLKMLPPNTPSSLKMALKGIGDFETLKDELRNNIKYLQDFGGLTGAAAHLAHDAAAPSPMDAAIQQPVEEESAVTEGDIPAYVMQNMTDNEKEGFIAAINKAAHQRRPAGRRWGPPQQQQQQRQPRAPPRDARDVRCGNCGATGHTAMACKKPKVPMEERKCHNCGEPGHIAARCKKAPRAIVAVADSGSQGGRQLAYGLMVEDEDGFVPVQRRRPTPRGLTLGELPIGRNVTQADRRALRRQQNRFEVFEENDAETNGPAIGWAPPPTPAWTREPQPISVRARGLCDFARPCNDADCGCDGHPASPRVSTVNRAGLSEAVRFILGPDYESECPKCDGSTCDGTCDVANLKDVEDEVIYWDPETASRDAKSAVRRSQNPEHFDAIMEEAAMYNAAREAEEKRVGSQSTSSSAASGTSTAPQKDAPLGGSTHGHSSAPTGYSAISTEPNTRPGVLADSREVPSVSNETSNMLLMYQEEVDEQVMTVEWVDVDIDVVLDSGCSDHVMNVELDAPGYEVGPSAGSAQGRGFIVGNGERVPNRGESKVNLRATDGQGAPVNFTSVFQSAQITRPLMSVAKICKNGYRCNFTEDAANVVDQQGATVCTFTRQNGIYVSRMKLRAPTPFGGQE